MEKIKAAKAFNYLATKKIIHQDMASRNVLLDSKQCPKISDFGLARKMDDEFTTYFAPIKKPLHMPWKNFSPEKFDDKKCPMASEVYGFGFLIYEIITRCNPAHPFDGRLNEDALVRNSFRYLKEFVQDPERRVRNLIFI